MILVHFLKIIPFLALSNPRMTMAGIEEPVCNYVEKNLRFSLLTMDLEKCFLGIVSR